MNDPAAANELDAITPAGPHATAPAARGRATQSAPPGRPRVTAAAIRADVTGSLVPHERSGSRPAGHEATPYRTIQEEALTPAVDAASESTPAAARLDCITVQGEMPGLVVGDCDARVRAEIAAHVAYCPECLALLESYRSLDAMLTRLDRYVSGMSEHPPAAVLPARIARRRRTSVQTGSASRAPQLRPVLTRQIASPVGPITVMVSADGICGVHYHSLSDTTVAADELRDRGFSLTTSSLSQRERDRLITLLDQATIQLAEYFAGTRDRFALPVDLGGVGEFTRLVLQATAEIPSGQLATYAGLAAKMGKPRAARAVGNALGRNPIPIIVPCHRVVRSDGSLGGYTGGVQIKEYLLSLERARVPTAGAR